MSSVVTLPVWVVVVAGLLAVLAILDRLLVPAFKWALRRKLNRTIDNINAKLRIKIKPFKLARRSVLIDNLMFDPEVLSAIDAQAAATGQPHEIVLSRAKGYAREIVPSFSAYTYFNVAMRVAERVSKYLYRVRLGAIDEEALAKIDPDASVVFVINHRSNMDYVLVTYMVSTRSALSYAVGEWARVWLLQSFIRSMGGYFVRRDSASNPLYRKVLARYVQMATAAGVTQAVFPEGYLTRDGMLQPPKLGLLSYLVSGFDHNSSKDIVFVPVGLNYDRVLEDRVQIGALDRGKAAAGEADQPSQADNQVDKKPPRKPRYKFSFAVFAGFLLRNLWLRLRGRWYRYGYAAVSFGKPLSLRDYLANRAINMQQLPTERRFAEIEQLGNRLMAEVGKVVPALPVALVARALLSATQNDQKNTPASEQTAGLTELELKGAVLAMIQTLQDQGAYVHIPRQDLEYSVIVGLRQLTLRRLASEQDGIYRANPNELQLLAYYANSIAHLFP